MKEQDATELLAIKCGSGQKSKTAGRSIHIVPDNARYQKCKAVMEPAQGLALNMTISRRTAQTSTWRKGSGNELTARIRAMTRTISGLPTNLYTLADLELDTETHTVKRGGKPITLTAREYMLLLSVVVLAFVSVVSASASNRQLQDALVGMVNANAREVEYDDGMLEIDDDFVVYRNGIYCLVFNGDGEKRGGRTPDEDLVNEVFEDGSVRTVAANGENYLIYDLKVSDKRRDIWIRGIVSESGNAIASSSLYYAILISLPLLILLAAVGGYLIARRSLRPIRKNSQTAEESGNSGDLSKRIVMEENGDELHRLAGTFNRMFDHLESNFEAEKQFTSDAAHELRTPVTTLLAQCEYAFENASGEDELYEVIGNIQKQGYRMSRLIESLLYFTRLEQRTEAPTFETIDLSTLITSVCHEQQELPEKDIQLMTDVQPGVGIKADPTLITRMTENLIRNAYRYGKENGTIKVMLAEADRKIVLSVSDDGIGIAQEELPKIWNRLYRADKSRTYSEGSGLGLGLAMVKQIARLHNGEVSVESELGKGSVFTVRLKRSCFDLF